VYETDIRAEIERSLEIANEIANAWGTGNTGAMSAEIFRAVHSARIHHMQQQQAREAKMPFDAGTTLGRVNRR
jgi:hypothetical protein